MTHGNRRHFLALATAASSATLLKPNSLLAQFGPAPSPTLFPESFLWGASTSAVQVENSPTLEGGGASAWEPFVAANPKRVEDGSSSRITCDVTHHWQEDIALMREMGLQAFRFSIYWPRVLPQGTGAVNQKGLDFYDRFIDGLVAARIKPFVTVFHFDVPEALNRQGGFLHDDSPKWLADYAQLLTTRYSDRVEEWLTVNEPNIFWTFASEVGDMPPGKRLEDRDLAKGLHHLLLGHGLSTQAIRAAAKHPVKIALPFAGFFSLPQTESESDIRVAREVSFSPEKIPLLPNAPPLAMLNNAIWLDPIFKGSFPERTLQAYPTLNELLRGDDLKTISTPVDRCAVNLYFSNTVRATPDATPRPVDAPAPQHSHRGWEITPDTLYWAPRFLHERYGKPVIITENGVSLADKPEPDGRVRDPQRIAFLNRYLNSLRRAVHEGVPVDGYMHWSLLDNWEFLSGFTEQFGLVYVDHKTQRRTLKESALYYRDIIRSRGAALG